VLGRIGHREIHPGVRRVGGSGEAASSGSLRSSKQSFPYQRDLGRVTDECWGLVGT
jgi:hypothetical protein